MLFMSKQFGWAKNGLPLRSLQCKGVPLFKKGWEPEVNGADS